MPDLAGSWPLVGRAEQVNRVLEHLSASKPGTVVVAGPPGVGKSRLLAEALRSVETNGFVIARVTATRSASSIPFGAIAPLLPVEDLLADSVVGVLQRAAKAIAGRGQGKPVVLAVDDAHLLDEASATLVHQLALDGAARLLLAIRTGEHLSASLAGVVNDTSTRTVELHDLSRREVDALTRSVLDGDVDGAVVQALWEGSRGNPLYMRELLVASSENGSVHLDGDMWRLSARPTVPARLAELIDARLATADDDERAVLELLAIGLPLGRDALEAIAGTEVINHLIQRGLVAVSRDGRRQPTRLHHPLYEEALRRQLLSRRLRATQLRLADVIEQRGTRRREDRLLLTTLRLDAGGVLDPELLEAAAMDAYFALDIELTERIARAGVAAGAGPRLRRILGETMRFQGRHEEAEVVLAGITLDALDDKERAMTASVRSENLFRGLGDHAGAVRLLNEARAAVRDPAWDEELAAMEVVFTALSGDVERAIKDSSEIIDRGPSRAMTMASTGAVAALAISGRADDATLVAEQAFAVASSMAPLESQVVLATHVMARCLGLVESGRLEEARSISQLSYDWSLAGGHQLGQAWFALMLGRCAQVRGRADESLRRYRESASVFRDLRDHGIRRWALAGAAQAAATVGRADLAMVALDELDTAPPTAVNVLEAEVHRARSWVALAQGAQTQARTHLLDGIEWARARSQHGLELSLLHDLVRLGDARDTASRAIELSAFVQGALAAARGAHAAGLRANDGQLLDDAAEAFATIGADLYAAEAAAHAALAHRRKGLDASASASTKRSMALATRCEGATTPALVTLTSQESARLTGRELEIATLAARGLTSREIAAQLAISVRTVDNQLQRAYAKLGISSRRELYGRLGPTAG